MRPTDSPEQAVIHLVHPATGGYAEAACGRWIWTAPRAGSWTTSIRQATCPDCLATVRHTRFGDYTPAHRPWPTLGQERDAALDRNP